MIVGIGNDLIDIRRIEKSLERFGNRFVQRIFTETEQKRSEGRATRAASYAKRFAAKEACAKALGTGIRAGVWWRDMGVVNLPSGRPTMKLTGGALAVCLAMIVGLLTWIVVQAMAAFWPAPALLLELGIPPHVVQAIARHADLDVTLSIYAHTNLDAMRTALDSIDWEVG